MSRRLLDALPEVAGRLLRRPRLLFCSDYDGTLAPVVDDPAYSRLLPGMRKALETLESVPNVTVALISGRERGDLQNRVSVPGLLYAGNHGLEISGPGLFFVEPTVVTLGETVRDLAAALRDRLKTISGVLVEDKGLTVTVHYRQVDDPGAEEEVRRIVHGILATSDHPFQLTQGDKKYEIRPRVNWNKGAALNWIRDQLGRDDLLTIYLGSDATDEEAFAALAEDITVRVGPPTETAAHFSISGPAEVLDFMEWLIDRMRQQPQRAAV